MKIDHCVVAVTARASRAQEPDHGSILSPQYAQNGPCTDGGFMFPHFGQRRGDSVTVEAGVPVSGALTLGNTFSGVVPIDL